MTRDEAWGITKAAFKDLIDYRKAQMLKTLVLQTEYKWSFDEYVERVRTIEQEHVRYVKTLEDVFGLLFGENLYKSPTP